MYKFDGNCISEPEYRIADNTLRRGNEKDEIDSKKICLREKIVPILRIGKYDLFFQYSRSCI